MRRGNLPRHRARALFVGAPLSLWVLLAFPAAAFALAGGGSGGFGGGGGGGGFGGGGFGGGDGGGGPADGGTGPFVLGASFVLVVVLYGVAGLVREWRARRREEEREPFSLALLLGTVRRVALWPVDIAIEQRRLGPRARRVRLAAAEATATDERFAPDAVRADAERLFRTIQAAWTADDRDTLAHLVGPDLMIEWEERLKDFARRGWTNSVEVRGSVHVDYVGLRNVAKEADKRVVVRITARVDDVVLDRTGETIHRRHSVTDTHNVCEYWTLGLRKDRWTLVSIEQHREGLHQLEEPIVASPWSDTSALAREATLEQAAGNRVENDQIASIASPDLAHDARIAALDLSLVDDRFAPQLLATEVEHAVRAWAEAVDGEDTALDAVALPAAVAQLLYPGDPAHRHRLVVRGARVRAIRIVQLDAHDTPPSMLVELRVSGRRYVEDRSTAIIVHGNRSVETAFTLRWRMELTDDRAHPWRIAAVTEREHATR
jgi:predicted lipid-binding transport protein (Tim44 family)